jgi:hypothetical protein
MQRSVVLNAACPARCLILSGSSPRIATPALGPWARAFREHGFRVTLDAGHALFEHARRLRPDFPTERDRAEDLAHHVALKRLLDRARRAFTVR